MEVILGGHWRHLSLPDDKEIIIMDTIVSF